MSNIRRVRAGQTYRYDPVMWDVFDPKTKLQEGDIVRVKNLHGCPPANTMGHCHVVDPQTGEFIGLVHVNSLHKT